MKMALAIFIVLGWFFILIDAIGLGSDLAINQFGGAFVYALFIWILLGSVRRMRRTWKGQ